MQFYFSNVEHARFSSFFALFFLLFSKNFFFLARPVKMAYEINFSLHIYQDTLFGGYFPFYDCPTLSPICPTQDEPSCIELKDPDDL